MKHFLAFACFKLLGVKNDACSHICSLHSEVSSACSEQKMISIFQPRAVMQRLSARALKAFLHGNISLTAVNTAVL